MTDETEHLEIYPDKHVYVSESGETETFEIGPQEDWVVAAYNRVKSRLQSGFFTNLVDEVERAYAKGSEPALNSDDARLVSDIVDGIHQDGRGIAGVCCVQLCVKALEPELDTRLHRGNQSSTTFSWKHGISLRVLDDEYIGQELTERELLRTNSDGGSMMTRQLAECRPYTPLFGRTLRGPRNSWLTLVSRIENDRVDAEAALRYLLYRLFEARDVHHDAVDSCIERADEWLEDGSSATHENVLQIITQHIDGASRAAFLLEVAVHSLVQASEENTNRFDTALPLKPQTSADRKSGELGDITLLKDQSLDSVVECKYGKSITPADIVALQEKLERHGETPSHVTYLSLDSPTVPSETERTADDLDIDVSFASLREYVARFRRTSTPDDWLTAYVETLGKRRQSRAHINESTTEWVTTLEQLLRPKTEQKTLDDLATVGS